MSISSLARSSTVTSQSFLHQKTSSSHVIICSTPANGLISRRMSHRASPLTKTIPPDSALVSPYKVLGTRTSADPEMETGLNEGVSLLHAVKAAPDSSPQRKGAQHISFTNCTEPGSPEANRVAKRLKEFPASPKNDHIDIRHGPGRPNPLIRKQIDRDERSPM
jgi:hypothetical protein